MATPYRLDVVAESAAMRKALALADLYAPGRDPLVLVGQTGTGKTHLARVIHHKGGTGGPFVARTAAELTRELALSQLFGHQAGAFTGAERDHGGLFAQAAGGTLLLDDFHLLGGDVQATLLRALSDGVFTPLGGRRDVPLACRLLVGLRACPDTLMREGVLLEDLRYRLGYCVIRMPRLAERREDIAPLAQRFLTEVAERNGAPVPRRLAPDVIAALEGAEWPGNVRQLQQVVRAAAVHAAGQHEIRFEHLPEPLRVVPRFDPRGCPQRNGHAVRWALLHTRGRVGAAAKLLGVHRNTIRAYASPEPNRTHSTSSPRCATQQSAGTGITEHNGSQTKAIA